jgi:branched-subunit amino acid transport protein
MVLCMTTHVVQAAMMVPKALDYTTHLEGLAAIFATLITILGRNLRFSSETTSFIVRLVYTV